MGTRTLASHGSTPHNVPCSHGHSRCQSCGAIITVTEVSMSIVQVLNSLSSAGHPPSSHQTAWILPQRISARDGLGRQAVIETIVQENAKHGTMLGEYQSVSVRSTSPAQWASRCLALHHPH